MRVQGAPDPHLINNPVYIYYMMRGGGVLPKPLLAAATLALLVFALVMLYWRLELILTNPCWSDAMEKLKPIEESVSRGREATLVLDQGCIRKVVFTSDPGTCEDTCEEYNGDVDQKRGCLKKCKAAPSETKTFVIALPVERGGLLGYKDRVVDAIGKRSFYWLFDGKPVVLSFYCQLAEFELASDECSDGGDPWVCTPDKKEVKSYAIGVEQLTEKTCRIVTA
jgi:hypothetical protein